MTRQVPVSHPILTYVLRTITVFAKKLSLLISHDILNVPIFSPLLISSDPAYAMSFPHNSSSLISEEAAVLHIVETFLSCIRTRNPTLMRSFVLPESHACLVRRGVPLHLTLPEVIDRIPWDRSDNDIYDEQISNSKVLIDQDIAMAWTPYKFYQGDRLNHTGTNIFTLWKRSGEGEGCGWVISGLSDIAREVERQPKDD